MIEIQELKDALEIIRLEDVEIEKQKQIQLKRESDVRRITAISYINNLNLIVDKRLSLANQKVKHYENKDLLKSEIIKNTYDEFAEEAEKEIENQQVLANLVKDKQRLEKIG